MSFDFYLTDVSKLVPLPKTKVSALCTALCTELKHLSQKDPALPILDDKEYARVLVFQFGIFSFGILICRLGRDFFFRGRVSVERVLCNFFLEKSC